MHSDAGATGRSLGHFDLDHRLSRRHREQVGQVTSLWRVGGAGDVVEPARLPDQVDPDLCVRALRAVVRRVLTPCGVDAAGVVVVQAPAGLVAITVSRRRVAMRALGPGVRDGWSPERPAVEECRVVRLDDRRVRTARREEPWIG